MLRNRGFGNDTTIAFQNLYRSQVYINIVGYRYIQSMQVDPRWTEIASVFRPFWTWIYPDVLTTHNKVKNNSSTTHRPIHTLS